LLYEYYRWIGTSTSIGTGWHYVAMTIDGSGVPSAYLDGVLLNSYAGTNAGAPGTSTNIGGYTTGGYARYFTGFVDEVRISKVARSANYFSDYYDCMKPN